MTEIRLTLPQRSPTPLMVPCTWIAPSRTAVSELMTAISPSLWVWIPNGVFYDQFEVTDDAFHFPGQCPAVGVAQDDRFRAAANRGFQVSSA